MAYQLLMDCLMPKLICLTAYQLLKGYLILLIAYQLLMDCFAKIYLLNSISTP